MRKSLRSRFRPAAAVWLIATLTATSSLSAHGIAHDEHEDRDTAPAIAPRDFHELWTTWGWEPVSITGLALAAGLYTIGLTRTWRASGIGHGVSRFDAACFAGGWLILFIALVSPLHPWGQVLFSAHMTQHELLMLIGAPLLVMGRPMAIFLRALPPSWSSSLARLGNTHRWQAIWSAITRPMTAWSIHALILWIWHAPSLFQATLYSEWIHALQHISFLGSALLFWWSLLHNRRSAAAYGVAVLYMFTTALHSGLLGALLTFARTAWYPDYAGRTQSWGLTPLEDQQLGGLIMWVPACLVYIIAGLILFAAWLRESDRRVLLRESSPAVQPGG